MFARGPQPGATPKADALKHYPQARAKRWAMGWVIVDGANHDKPISHGRSAMKAWWNVEPSNTKLKDGQ
jgi:hypothetical protein